jgi:hypothetical protein
MIAPMRMAAARVTMIVGPTVGIIATVIDATDEGLSAWKVVSILAFVLVIWAGVTMPRTRR